MDWPWAHVQSWLVAIFFQEITPRFFKFNRNPSCFRWTKKQKCWKRGHFWFFDIGGAKTVTARKINNVSRLQMHSFQSVQLSDLWRRKREVSSSPFSFWRKPSFFFASHPQNSGEDDYHPSLRRMVIGLNNIEGFPVFHETFHKTSGSSPDVYQPLHSCISWRWGAVFFVPNYSERPPEEAINPPAGVCRICSSVERGLLVCVGGGGVKYNFQITQISQIIFVWQKLVIYGIFFVLFNNSKI